MRAAVIVASLSVLAVCVLGQTCLTNVKCHSGFSCSADQDPACIDNHCTCITTHTCTQTSQCRDISACHANLRHHEVCFGGKCHCADITDVIGGVIS